MARRLQTGAPMKRLILATLIAATASTAASVATYAFNDKGAIVHNGRVLCIDWHGWTQHQLHGDLPFGPFPHSCDVPPER
jgi:hypothetical protein